MKKITIKDLEKITDYQDLSLDELKDNGFEKGSECKEIEGVINRLEIELAKKRLTHKERKIVELIEFGYTYKQIEEETSSNPKTIKSILDKMGK